MRLYLVKGRKGMTDKKKKIVIIILAVVAAVLAAVLACLLFLPKFTGKKTGETGASESVKAAALAAEDAYAPILELYETKAMTKWTVTGVEPVAVSDLWSRAGESFTVSHIGYHIEDLNGDDIQEMIVSPDRGEQGAGDGMIYDLYTLQNGEAHQLASSGEQSRYYLAEDGAILHEGGGAQTTSNTIYRISADGTRLEPVETVCYDAAADPDNPWHYSDAPKLTDSGEIDYGALPAVTESEYNEKLAGFPHASAMETKSLEEYVKEKREEASSERHEETTEAAPEKETAAFSMIKDQGSSGYTGYILDESGLLTQIKYYNEDGSIDSVAVTFLYDEAGRILEIRKDREAGNGHNGLQHAYTYDSQGRLIKTEGVYIADTWREISYTYDAEGRVSVETCKEDIGLQSEKTRQYFHTYQSGGNGTVIDTRYLEDTDYDAPGYQVTRDQKNRIVRGNYYIDDLPCEFTYRETASLALRDVHPIDSAVTPFTEILFYDKAGSLVETLRVQQLEPEILTDPDGTPLSVGNRITMHGLRDAKKPYPSVDTAAGEYTFASGVGGWSTGLTLQSDWSFSGGYHDSNAGEVYVCDFKGAFTAPKQKNDYCYSLNLASLDYPEPDREYDSGNVHYITSTPYGIYGGEEFLIYLPGAPISAMDEGCVSWLSRYGLPSDIERLPDGYYVLYNVKEEDAFIKRPRG